MAAECAEEEARRARERRAEDVELAALGLRRGSIRDPETRGVTLATGALVWVLPGLTG